MGGSFKFGGFNDKALKCWIIFFFSSFSFLFFPLLLESAISELFQFPSSCLSLMFQHFLGFGGALTS